MCGRYTLIHGLKELRERFEFDPAGLTLDARYNLAPGQMAPVIVVDEEGNRVLRMMKWGLVPFWAEDPKIGNRMINARAETITEKSTFKRPLQRQRCLIPADGFYEWREIPGRKGKFPMRIVLKGEPPFAFAGLWDSWKSPEGEPLESFTIVTTGANSLIRRVHERMPVIVRPEDEAAWLDPENHDPEALVKFLRAYPPDQMETYDVSKAVNSPENDSPECIHKTRN